jgi:hypothetical protein
MHAAEQLFQPAEGFHAVLPASFRIRADQRYREQRAGDDLAGFRQCLDETQKCFEPAAIEAAGIGNQFVKQQQTRRGRFKQPDQPLRAR